MLKGDIKNTGSLLKWTCIEYKDQEHAKLNYERLRGNIDIEMKLKDNNILLHSDNIDKLSFSINNFLSGVITKLYSII